MAQFIAFTSNAMVSSDAVLSVIDGVGVYKQRALQFLSENGIQDPKPGMWYLQQDWLNAFKAISEATGEYTLFGIGQKIPENAMFPPEIDDIEKALSSIDVAYHMNHMIDGEVLFNPETGIMKEGIGHYGYEKIDDKTIKMVCNNPYPCNFDKGIIDSMAQKFKPSDAIIITKHDDSGPCRKKGGDSCTYLVSW